MGTLRTAAAVAVIVSLITSILFASESILGRYFSAPLGIILICMTVYALLSAAQSSSSSGKNTIERIGWALAGSAFLLFISRHVLILKDLYQTAPNLDFLFVLIALGACIMRIIMLLTDPMIGKYFSQKKQNQ